MHGTACLLKSTLARMRSARLSRFQPSRQRPQGPTASSPTLASVVTSECALDFGMSRARAISVIRHSGCSGVKRSSTGPIFLTVFNMTRSSSQ